MPRFWFEICYFLDTKGTQEWVVVYSRYSAQYVKNRHTLKLTDRWYDLTNLTKPN